MVMLMNGRTWTRAGRLLIGPAALVLLLSACGQEAASEAGSDAADSSAQESDKSGTADSTDKADAADSLGDETPVAGTDGKGRCPAGVTSDSLGKPTQLGTADIDGDGTDDQVSLGRVPGGGQACGVAVLVTTADGTFAAPVAGADQAVVDSPLADPVFAQVDGAAGAEIVLTTSFHPRGGGELGMFSWVDGGLVQVEQGGKPWSLFATIDDGGGTPRLLSCSAGGFTDVSAYPPGSDAGSTVTTYALREGVVREQQRSASKSATWKQVQADHPALPRAGLEVFPDCQ